MFADRLGGGDKLVEGEAMVNSGAISGIALPPLDGTVRFKVDDFTFARFSWTPFQATASLSPNGIRADIERGDLCGVSTIGKVDFTDGEIGLDLSLSVPDGQLESTSPCLTKNRYVLTGSYSFKGRLAGQGVPEKVLQTLRGEFEFSARDGEFRRLHRGWPEVTFQ
jgi:hypothetical protein